MLILLLYSDADSAAEEIFLRVGSVRTMNFERVKPASPVTVAEACTVFARSEAGIVGSNPTQDIDVCYVYVFILFVLSYV
jgi:hypothetical protein